MSRQSESFGRRQEPPVAKAGRGSLFYALRLRRERRRLARSENRLRNLDRAIRDHVYNLEHWAFADRPSERDDRKAAIHALIRRYEAAGGDVLDVLPYGFDYLAAEAMPTAFERKRQIGGNRWNTHRVALTQAALAATKKGVS